MEPSDGALKNEMTLLTGGVHENGNVFIYRTYHSVMAVENS